MVAVAAPEFEHTHDVLAIETRIDIGRDAAHGAVEITDAAAAMVALGSKVRVTQHAFSAARVHAASHRPSRGAAPPSR